VAYIHIPTNAAVTEPAKIHKFLDAMATCQRPVFIHCMQGRDRTGLEIAVYRVVMENWSREDALRELYAHGYNWALFPGIARYVKTFDPSKFNMPAAPLVGG
jgi:protein tyrosine/serine phosphatase